MTSVNPPYILLLTIEMCFLSLAAAAGDKPKPVQRAAPVHKFLDAKNIGLQCANVLVMAADQASSRRALQVPGTSELNPLARSQGALLGLKVAGMGAGLGMAYVMHRTGHHKLERIVPVVFGAPSAVAAVHNAGIHR